MVLKTFNTRQQKTVIPTIPVIIIRGEFPVHRVGKWGLAAESDSLSWGDRFESLWKPKQLELIGQSTGEERTAQVESIESLTQMFL